MPKIIISSNANPASDAKRDSLIKRVADSLGILCEDVVLLPVGMTAAVIDVPADLTKAREKKDAHDAAEKEKAEKEKAKAEAEQAKAEAAQAAALVKAEHKAEAHSHHKVKE